LTIVIPKDAAEFKQLLDLFMNADHPDKRISLVTDTPYQAFDVPESLARHVGVLPAADQDTEPPPEPAATTDTAPSPAEVDPQPGEADPGDSDDGDGEADDSDADEAEEDEPDTGAAGATDKPNRARTGTRKKTSPAGGTKRKETA
jgi:hypothetical protein